MANTQDLALRIAAQVRPVAAALSSRADALAARTELLETKTGDLETRATGLGDRLGLLERRSYRSVSVTLPQLAVGNNEVDVTWAIPFVDADYGLTLTIEAGPLALSRLSAGIKAGSRIGAGCVAVVTNSSQIAIPAGVLLHALAWRVLGQE